MSIVLDYGSVSRSCACSSHVRKGAFFSNNCFFCTFMFMFYVRARIRKESVEFISAFSQYCCLALCSAVRAHTRSTIRVCGRALERETRIHTARMKQVLTV